MWRISLIAILLFANVTEAKTNRSSSVKAEFQRSYPCPSTGSTKGACKGYVNDHIKALACGGLDIPSNLQWQTVADAKEKDKWERKGCKK